MATNISPGVYTKVIDLSNYVQAVPSSTGLIVSLAEKGRDNELVFVGSRSELIAEFGEPNIVEFGKNYGQGLYCAYNFLGESGSLYFMRVLPDDAAYSNIRIDSTMPVDATSVTMSATYVSSANTKAEVKTNLETAGDVKPVCMLYPIGRGEHYNKLGVRITAHSNPMLDGVYVLDIYEKQSDGQDEIIESFDISFNPDTTDDSGDSIFIEDVLESYSTVLRADMTLTSGEYTDGYKLTSKVYDKNVGEVSATDSTSASTATITDNKQDFSDWENSTGTGMSDYSITAYDSKGNKLTGWLGQDSGTDNETIAVFNNRDLDTAVQNWIGTESSFDFANEIHHNYPGQDYDDLMSGVDAVIELGPLLHAASG